MVSYLVSMTDQIYSPGPLISFLKAASPLSSCCCLVTKSCPTLCDPMDSSTPAFPVLYISWSLGKLMSIKLRMPSNYLILCCPLLLLPLIFPSIRVFANELALGIRQPHCWSFSFSIGPYNEYSGLIFFRIEWFDLLAA